MTTILQNSINANSTTPLLPVQGGTGVSSPTAHGILVGEGASAVNPITLTNGQILIGSTGSDPSAATLTQGTGITITNGAGTITIANSEPAGTTWSVKTTATTLAAFNGYFNNASTGSVTFTLPATAALGDTYQVANINAASFVIAEASGQSIILGNTTALVSTGTITSNNTIGDWIEIVCAVANTTFIATMREGSANVVVS
jgi:hypothetical protein